MLEKRLAATLIGPQVIDHLVQGHLDSAAGPQPCFIACLIHVLSLPAFNLSFLRLDSPPQKTGDTHFPLGLLWWSAQGLGPIQCSTKASVPALEGGSLGLAAGELGDRLLPGIRCGWCPWFLKVPRKDQLGVLAVRVSAESRRTCPQADSQQDHSGWDSCLR